MSLNTTRLFNICFLQFVFYIVDMKTILITLEKLCLQMEVNNMKKFEIEKMVQDLMTIDATWTGKLWSRLADELTNAGFECKVVKGNGLNRNYVYKKADCDYVVIIIASNQLGANNVKPIIVDKVLYEERLSNTIVNLNLSCNDKELRPIITNNDKGYRTNFKLHRMVVNASSNDTIDHISHSGSVCTKEMLRVVTLEQNMLNKKFRSRVYPELRFFEGTCRLSEEQRSYLTSKGYELAGNGMDNKYIIMSPKFADKEDFYKALNDFENTVMGEYRYDPILSCETNVSLYLYIMKCTLGLSVENFVTAKITELDLLKDKVTKLYYGL